MCDELCSYEQLYGEDPPYMDEPMEYFLEEDFKDYESQFNMTADFFMLESSKGIPEPDVWENYIP